MSSSVSISALSGRGWLNAHYLNAMGLDEREFEERV